MCHIPDLTFPFEIPHASFSDHLKHHHISSGNSVAKVIQGTAIVMRNILAITRCQGDDQMGFPPEKNIVIDLTITNKRLVTLWGAVKF